MARRPLSVVVPHYGSPAPALALLRMLRSQEGDLDLEVIVVDDCSPEPFPDRPGVHVVRRAENGGFGSAVNTGAAAATHPLLLVLNSDVRIEADFVARLLDAAEPWQPAVVSPRVVDEQGEDVWVGRHFPTAAQQAVEWLTPLARWRDRASLHRAVGHDVEARGRTAVVDWVIGAALLIPLEPFRTVGGFDERFHMNAEEVDLQRRLLALGDASGGPGGAAPGPRGGWVVRPGAEPPLVGGESAAIRREVGRTAHVAGILDRGYRSQPGGERGAADRRTRPRSRGDRAGGAGA